MKFKYIIMMILVSLFSSGIAQESEFYYLRHLSKQEYIEQVKNCSIEGLAEAGIRDIRVDYNGSSYNWITTIVDKTIQKHFSKDFLKHENERSQTIYYDIKFKKVRKHLYYYLTIYKNEALVGSTPILVSQVEDPFSSPDIIGSSKKEIKKILEEAVTSF